MKGIFDFIFGGDTYEIMAKGGFAGGFLGALRLSGTTLEKLIHFFGGLFSAVFLGPIIIELLNLFLKKMWQVEVNSIAVVGGVGFTVGLLGVDGLYKLWEKMKLAQVLRKFLFFWLTNKENENGKAE